MAQQPSSEEAAGFNNRTAAMHRKKIKTTN